MKVDRKPNTYDHELAASEDALVKQVGSRIAVLIGAEKPEDVKAIAITGKEGDLQGKPIRKVIKKIEKRLKELESGL